MGAGVRDRLTLGGYELSHNVPRQHVAPGVFSDSLEIVNAKFVEIQFLLSFFFGKKKDEMRNLEVKGDGPSR